MANTTFFITKILFIILSFGSLYACSSSDNKNIELSFISPKKGKIYNDKTDILVKINTTKNVDSIILSHNRTKLSKSSNLSWKIVSDKLTMGNNLLVADAYKDGKIIKKKYIQFKVIPKNLPKEWHYNIIRKIPHTTSSFTQGLFFYNNKLYEGTGERGHSKVMTINPENGKILKSTKLAPSYFGEGITIANNKIYQITWTSGVGFTYDTETLTETSSFNYSKDSSQGWGLTTYDDLLVMSNGSHQLLFFTPNTMQLVNFIEVYSPLGEENMLNELEYAKGYIFANVWLKNYIVVINPKSGKLIAKINCSDLVKKELEMGITPSEDVLNGIAYNKATDTFYITGKRWHHIYEVKLLDK